MEEEWFALFSLRSLNRADTGTGTAVNTDVCVDHVLAIAFGDRADGAFTFAGTARDAIIGNNICHFRFTSAFYSPSYWLRLYCNRFL